MSKTLLIKLGLLVIVGGFSLTAQKPAQAQVMDECQIWGAMTAIYSWNCASASNQRSLHTYLSTGRNTSLTGVIGGAAGMNDGIIELLRRQNDLLAKSVESGRQDMPNQDLGNRAALVDAEIRRAIADKATPISAAACRDVTASSPLGGGPRGGGSAGTNSNEFKAKLDKEIQDQVLEPKHDLTHLADIAMSPTAPRYCTQKDVDNKMPGCESNVGLYPAANMTADTLFRRTMPRGSESVGNHSIPDSGNPAARHPAHQAVIDYSMWNRPFSGPDLTEAAKGTGAGGQYLVYQRRYNARVLAISETYNLVASKSMALPKDHPFSQIWDGALDGPSQGDNFKEMFEEVYGDKVIFPTEPSEREIMNILVMGQFTTQKASRDMQASGDDLLKRQLELTKINNYIALKQLEQAEWNNVLLAHLLSNTVEPITRDELEGLARSAGHARE